MQVDWLRVANRRVRPYLQEQQAHQERGQEREFLGVFEQQAAADEEDGQDSGSETGRKSEGGKVQVGAKVVKEGQQERPKQEHQCPLKPQHKIQRTNQQHHHHEQERKQRTKIRNAQPDKTPKGEHCEQQQREPHLDEGHLVGRRKERRQCSNRQQIIKSQVMSLFLITLLSNFIVPGLK